MFQQPAIVNCFLFLNGQLRSEMQLEGRWADGDAGAETPESSEHLKLWIINPSERLELASPTTMARLLSLVALAAYASAQSLTVVNQCGNDVFLYTQNSFGTISNNVALASGATQNLGISSDWDGAVNVGQWAMSRLGFFLNG